MAVTELYSLISLFKATKEEKPSFPLEKIEIPLIQRDYAQGRKTQEVTRIRKRFIDSLYNALVQGKTLKLDFIYGGVKDKVLTPLDGQQRLTTLFLLHWYIARHENVQEERIDFLNNFSYETRYSARTFCKYLVKYTPDFDCATLSENITDQSWMPLDWKHDPTISVMLNMLDDIHAKFKSTNGLWKKLEDGCISFYFLSITDMGLTDDLYIKMNSRGKPLTEFEHFKAEWEGYMKAINTDFADSISRKIDIDWTDMLWPYKGDNNIIDDEFVRFYKYLCAILYFKKYPLEAIHEDIFDLTKSLFYEKADDAKKNLLFIEESFDCLCGKDIKATFEKFLTNEPHITGKSHISETIDVFEHCCNNFGERKTERVRSFSIGRMITLYAFLLYWKNCNSITDVQFAKRFRIINNMINASEFELREDRMKVLLDQTEEVILRGEIKIEENRNTFNGLQVQEELDKQKWLQQHPEKEETIHYLEDHPLLNGGMSVIGLDYIDYTDRFYSLFSCDRGLINRALLAIGDYSLKIGWRYQIGTAKIENTWKAIFHTNKENIQKVHGILIQLLSKSKVFTDNILQGIIDDYVAKATVYDWRYYIIKYDSMRPEKYGMYYWYDNQLREKDSYRIIMMMTEKSIGGKNFNIFLKTLYDRFKAEYPDKAIRLGEYAYSGDGNKLELSFCNKLAYYTNNDFVIEDADDTESRHSISILQEENNRRDLVDRIDIGWNGILSLI